MLALQISIIGLSVAALLTAYGLYYNSLRQATIFPSKVSWLIWSASSLLETITYGFVTNDYWKVILFATSTCACILITIKIWVSRGTMEMSITDRVITIICLVAVLIWVFSNEPLLTHFVMLFSIPLAFYPTIREIKLNPFAEQPIPWSLWLLSDVLACTLVLIRLEDITELPFVVIELSCHVAVLASIFISRSAIRKRIGFAIGQNQLGKAVFAQRKFEVGAFIMQFQGQQLSSLKIIAEHISPDYIMEIGPDIYLGPSGMADDFINHSCDPNSGVIVANSLTYLIAIKSIDVGDEITWDYATTASESLNMLCRCNTLECRGVITNFRNIPHYVKFRYISHGIVPKHLLTEKS